MLDAWFTEVVATTGNLARATKFQKTHGTFDLEGTGRWFNKLTVIPTN